MAGKHEQRDVQSKGPSTILDVARMAGVSETTARRALRNDPRVKMKTIERVNKAAEDLRYRRNLLAKSFLTQKSCCIGVIVPYLKGACARVLTGVHDEADANGYHLIVYSLENAAPGQESTYIGKLIERMVDGVILWPSIHQSMGNAYLQELHERHLPFVVLDEESEHLDANLVLTKDERGAFDAVDYLIRLGHRRIAHIAGPQELPAAQRRFHGYLAALEQYGIPFRAEYVHEMETFHEDDQVQKNNVEWVKTIMRRIDPPSAFFCATDFAAAAIYPALRQLGLSVPGDVSVIGYSDNEFAMHLPAPLTSVRQPFYDMGRAAMRLLLDKLQGVKLDTFDRVVLPTELIIRESTAPVHELPGNALHGFVEDSQ
jgi:DNA-binding LacI/PurR family transcriptional regulator